MAVEHHDLAHEFPEMKEIIHQLKTSNNHFRKLFDEYHDVTRSVENMENEVTPVSTETEEKRKKRRLQLKDELFAMMQQAN